MVIVHKPSRHPGILPDDSLPWRAFVWFETALVAFIVIVGLVATVGR